MLRFTSGMPDNPTEQRTAKAQVKLADSAKTLERSAVRQEQSVVRQEHSAVRQEDSADRRTVLAADRTVLAAERTYAAWIRTGLAALASGVGARALLQDVVYPALAAATGSVLILFSAFCFVAAVWRELRPGAPPPMPDISRLPRALLVVVNGFLVLVSLAALVGVWLTPR